MKLVHEEETYKILGACFEVYKEKGSGFLEAVYQERLELELASQRLPFVVKPQLQLFYKGQLLKQGYQPDFVCFGSVVLEIKAVSALADEHRAQVQNYLKGTGHRVGLLVNFGHYPKVEYERIIR